MPNPTGYDKAYRSYEDQETLESVRAETDKLLNECTNKAASESQAIDSEVENIARFLILKTKHEIQERRSLCLPRSTKDSILKKARGIILNHLHQLTVRN